MGDSQQFSLRWNNYLNHITVAFESLRKEGDLVDVTLSCEGKKIRAHKMLLSACSTYFRDLFKENPCQHPVIIFRNVRFEDLSALVDFMYQGEVNVAQEQLSSFLTTAELLAVQGLSDGYATEPSSPIKESEPLPVVHESTMAPPVSLFPITSPGKRRSRMLSTQHRKRRQSAEVIKTEALDYDDHDDSSGSFDVNDQLSTLLENNSTTSEHHLDYADAKDGLTTTDINSIISQPGTSTDDTLHETSLHVYRMRHGGNDLTEWQSSAVDQDNAKEYQCQMCNKKFQNVDSLYKHKDFHKGKTQCPICQTMLSRLHHLRRHMMAIHGVKLESAPPCLP